MKRAVSYLRVSGKGQVSGDGFPRQRAAVKRYAKRARLDLVAEYRDEGVSGTNELTDRPGLAALLDHLESNGVRVVIVERADRLARDLIVSEIILSQLRDRGVQVLDSIGTDLSDNTDPQKNLMRQVLASFAEYDKAITVLKLRAARDRLSRAAGRRIEGRKAFGYYEGEEEALQIIRRLRRKPRGKGKRRMSYAAIAETLTARAVPTRTGGDWHWRTVQDILSRSQAIKLS